MSDTMSNILKKITCIECPKGCPLSIESSGSAVVSISGNACPQGAAYGRQEIEDPRRILTTTVSAEGLVISRVPVRTSKPIAKKMLFTAMRVLRSVRLEKPVLRGDIIMSDFLEQGVSVVATRDAAAKKV